MPAGGVSDWLAAREAAVADLRPGAEKRVLWSGRPEAPTDWSVVYVHGFSASAGELRPLPDRVAGGLGANLFFTRLAGHGRDGAAMAEASLEDWMRDMTEALAVGRRIGRRVLVMGCSTGATLIALALARDKAPEVAEVAGAVLLSPNFGLRDRRSAILIWPGMGRVLPLILGPERGFVPRNAGHAAAWTTRYPVGALIPMARAVQASRRVRGLRVPVLTVFDPGDRVVDSRISRAMAARWGATVQEVRLGDGDDSARHIIAGDILSPGMTVPVAAQVLDWARGL
ncbi:hypothetical protein P279_20915 [Rhodobacteraceae bacterium PD-2]|nr:hypothetical protein P279_20915 [Rhodobacteraceae bacterium PD-2]